MLPARQTPEHEGCYAKLRDRVARARIDIRIRRLSLGQAGDVEPVGDGVFELKIDRGPGYRVYFVQHGAAYLLLLVGGDKGGQARDIKRAKQLAKKYME